MNAPSTEEQNPLNHFYEIYGQGLRTMGVDPSIIRASLQSIEKNENLMA
jgi:hypothetical protein